MRAFRSSRMGYRYFPYHRHWTTAKPLECRAAKHTSYHLFFSRIILPSLAVCFPVPFMRLCTSQPLHSSMFHIPVVPVSQCFTVKSCTANSTCWLGPTRHRRLRWRRRLDEKSGEPFWSHGPTRTEATAYLATSTPLRLCERLCFSFSWRAALLLLWISDSLFSFCGL